MNWQFTPLIFPLIISALITAFLASLGARRKKVTGAFAYAVVMFAVTEWSLGNALELASTTLGGKIFWARIEYIGIVTIPLAWLVFSLQYTGRSRWLSRAYLSLLSIIPILTLIFVWTNNAHHLIWSQVNLDSSSGLIVMDPVYGWWFWIHTAVSYLYLLIGSIVLVTTLLRSAHLYRGQIAALLVGVAIPWVGNAIYIFGLSPLPQMDLTPLTFTLAGIVMGWGLLRYKLLDITPIARSAILENLNDGVVVVDLDGRIIDLNKLAEKILHTQSAEAIGKSVWEVIRSWPDLPLGSQPARLEITLGYELAPRYFELLISPLFGPSKKTIGYLALLHDISDRKRAEQVIRREKDYSARRNAQLTAIAQVARDAAAVHNLTALLTLTARLISEHFSFYHCGIFLLDEAGEYAVLHAANSPGGQVMLARKHKLRVAPAPGSFSSAFPVGIVGTVARTGKSRIALDVGKDAVFFDNPDLPETHSEMAFPLKVREKIIGVLDVQSTQEAAFAEEDLEVLQILADQIALAIDNARLFEDSERTLNNLQAINRKLAGDTWQQSASENPRCYYYDELGARILDTAPEGFEPLEGTGQQATDKILRLPIELRGLKVGTLFLKRDPSQEQWSAAETAVVQEAIAQVSLALESARLFTDTQKHAARDRLVADITTQLRAENDPDRIMQIAVTELSRSLHADRVQVLFQQSALQGQYLEADSQGLSS